MKNPVKYGKNTLMIIKRSYAYSRFRNIFSLKATWRSTRLRLDVEPKCFDKNEVPLYIVLDF